MTTPCKLERRVEKGVGSYLLKYAKDITSQGGEDGIIDYIFSSVLRDVISKVPICVDVGAWDGYHLSNTYTLLNEKQWGGVLIEADISRHQQLQLRYAGRADVHCISSFVELAGDMSLVKYLRDFQVPTNFEFISIDIDGADYYVWKSLHGFYSPMVVCIEFNPTIPNRVCFVQEPDVRIHQGSSLLALVDLGKELGYSLIATTTFNAFFVRNDYLQLFEPVNSSSLDLINPCTMSTEIFQTYDGEIKFVGPLKLLWHRLAINPQKLQVLSKKQRYFPFAPPGSTREQEERFVQQFKGVRESSIRILSTGNCCINCKQQFRSAFEQFLIVASELLVVPRLEALAIDGLIAIILPFKLVVKTKSCAFTDEVVMSIFHDTSNSLLSRALVLQESDPETAVNMLEDSIYLKHLSQGVSPLPGGCSSSMNTLGRLCRLRGSLVASCYWLVAALRIADSDSVVVIRKEMQKLQRRVDSLSGELLAMHPVPHRATDAGGPCCCSSADVSCSPLSRQSSIDSAGGVSAAAMRLPPLRLPAEETAGGSPEADSSRGENQEPSINLLTGVTIFALGGIIGWLVNDILVKEK